MGLIAASYSVEASTRQVAPLALAYGRKRRRGPPPVRNGDEAEEEEGMNEISRGGTIVCDRGHGTGWWSLTGEAPKRCLKCGSKNVSILTGETDKTRAIPKYEDAVRSRIASEVSSIKMGDILLHLGEMTAQEKRTCKALLGYVAHRIRNAARTSGEG
jgi:hypothetical protein